MNNYSQPEPVNVGLGEDLTIEEIAKVVIDALGADLQLRFDTTKPDGIFRKVVDVTAMQTLGWAPKHSLSEGVKLTYQAYLAWLADEQNG